MNRYRAVVTYAEWDNDEFTTEEALVEYVLGNTAPGVLLNDSRLVIVGVLDTHTGEMLGVHDPINMQEDA